jgi:hypothetical protein
MTADWEIIVGLTLVLLTLAVVSATVAGALILL